MAEVNRLERETDEHLYARLERRVVLFPYVCMSCSYDCRLLFYGCLRRGFLFCANFVKFLFELNVRQ
jgi:hypothetical protein